MADFPAFDVDGDGANNGARSTAGTFWTEIDDDPNAGQPDADYIYGPNNGNGDVFCLLEAMPGDFGDIDTLLIEVFTAISGWSNDTWVLYAQIFDVTEATNYTDEITLATKSEGADTTGDSGQLSFTINATGLAASKGDWDGARVWFRWDFSQTKGGDGAELRLHAIEFTGTYTEAGPGAPVQADHQYRRRRVFA